jgi:RHS repeat-associated protein
MRAMANFLRTMCGLLVIAVFLVGGFPARADVITYYHNDLVGSPRVATNASGQIVWTQSYSPHGERLNGQLASNKIWYTSRHQDDDTGLVYMGARYYDPVAGRFAGVDPKMFDSMNIHSFNRYTYANNNPYRYLDPDGRSAASIAVVGGLALGWLLLPEQTKRQMGESAVNGLRRLYNIFNESSESKDGGKADAGQQDGPVPGATPGRETKGRTTQWEKPGDMSTADKDFDDKGPTDVRELPNGGRTGTLSDGRTITVRPTSTDGRPTLEIQDGKNRHKVRYGE